MKKTLPLLLVVVLTLFSAPVSRAADAIDVQIAAAQVEVDKSEREVATTKTAYENAVKVLDGAKTALKANPTDVTLKAKVETEEKNVGELKKPYDDAEKKLTGLRDEVAKLEKSKADSVKLDKDNKYQASLEALTMLFVLAVLLENGMALIFNWSVFLTYFSLRAWRPLLMFFAAVLVVKFMQVDVVASLVNVYRDPQSDVVISGWFSKGLTALILAGGSAGVYNIMVALGFRNKKEEEVRPKLDETQAWLSIKVTGIKGKGKIIPKIRLKRTLPSPPVAGDPMPMAGSMGEDRPHIGDLFFNNSERFPGSGGYRLISNTVYEIEIVELKGDKQEVIVNRAEYAFAPRAIVDLEFKYPEP